MYRERPEGYEEGPIKKGDIVSLKGTKNPRNILVVFERVGDDLVKVCNLDGYDEQVLPMKALKHPNIKSNWRR